MSGIQAAAMRIAVALALIAVLCTALLPREDARGAELLTNGGFENDTTGWGKSDGSLEAVPSPVKEGGAAARFAADASPSSQLVYQSVTVSPGQDYEFSGWILHNDPAVDQVFLRIVWLDQFGGLVRRDDSGHLTSPAPEFRPLTIGPDNAPAAARSARVEVRVLTNGNFAVFLDGFSLHGPDQTPPPTSAPTRSPTPPPTLGPTTTATAPPAPATPTPNPQPTRTPAATAVPASPTPEPSVFPQLTNGGFELQRGDGTPFAWRKFGGEMLTTDAQRVEGDSALALLSTTGSTKWVYQTVKVDPNLYYEGSAYTLPPGSGETFLRISWYASDDGSGSAIGSDDSIDSAGIGSAFTLLRTGPVQAPSDARTARVRLMMRPGTDSRVTAYFDAVTFGRSGPPSANSSGGVEHTTSGSVLPGDTTGASATRAPATEVTPGPGSAVLGALKTPVALANVTPPPRPLAKSESDGKGSNYELAIIAFAVATPIAGFGLIAAKELRRTRRNG